MAMIVCEQVSRDIIVFPLVSVRGAHLLVIVRGDHLLVSVRETHLLVSVRGARLSFSVRGDHLSVSVRGDHLSVSVRGAHLSVSVRGDHLSVSVRGDHLLISVRGAHLLVSVTVCVFGICCIVSCVLLSPPSLYFLVFDRLSNDVVQVRHWWFGRGGTFIHCRHSTWSSLLVRSRLG